MNRPPTPRLRPIAPKAFGAGGKGIRTPDFQLAKLALYQLSYAPTVGIPNVDWRFAISTKYFLRSFGLLIQASDAGIRRIIMEHIISPTTLSLADVLKAVYELEMIDPFGHFVTQLIFYSQPQRRTVRDG